MVRCPQSLSGPAIPEELRKRSTAVQVAACTPRHRAVCIPPLPSFATPQLYYSCQFCFPTWASVLSPAQSSCMLHSGAYMSGGNFAHAGNQGFVELCAAGLAASLHVIERA